jgi:hypothetical protein
MPELAQEPQAPKQTEGGHREALDIWIQGRAGEGCKALSQGLTCRSARALSSLPALGGKSPGELEFLQVSREGWARHWPHALDPGKQLGL